MSPWFDRSLAILALAALPLGAPIPAAAAQEPAQEQSGGEDEKKEEGKEAEEESEEEKGEQRFFAVTGGEVHTGTGAVLRGATVLARNGKITAIGYDLDVPPEARVLEAKGLHVYPGIVTASSQGLLGSSGSDFEDTIDPFNTRMILGLSSGITTTGVSSGAVKLKRFSVRGVTVREKIFTTLSWSNRNPASKRSLREKMQKASEYLRRYREWEEKVKKDKELKEPAKKDVDTTIVSVLKGETRAKFVANERDDLLGIAHLAQEFGFRPVIEGCVEGWTVADELGRAGAFAVVTPRDRRPKDERVAAQAGSSIENAAILHRAGVQVAVIPSAEGVDLGGIVGRDILHITVEANFAVRGGMPEEAALASITTVPARILGIGHRVGSLEVGKDCDLAVTDGDLLHYRTFVQYTVVDGKLVYDKEKELFFAHIRPRPPAQAPEKKLDKGESETKPESEAEPAKPEEGEAKDAEKKDDEEKEDEEKDEEEKDEEKKDEEKKGGEKKGGERQGEEPGEKADVEVDDGR